MKEEPGAMQPKKGRSADLMLIAIAILSAFLNMYDIWNDRTANAYYTAAVTSMLQSFHNFFYASFDPGGFVTVDKPPVTFWVQTVFAYFLGVHGWSVILPQALAGVGSVLLMYVLVKPAFGKTAARLASLVMACTPIAVAVSRTNNVDSMLVFALLLAVWMLLRGIRKQKIAWILGAFAMIGVGFNMKMLQAYMIVPALYLFYLLAFKSKWKKKLLVLAAATAIMAGISVSWAVIVDSVPQENRPYIGSSQTNSVLELAFGYNGINRLTGNMGRGGRGSGGGAMPDGQRMERADGALPGGQQMQQGADGAMPGGQQMQPGGEDGRRGQWADRGGPGGGPGGGGPGGGGMFGTGQPGPLRLFQTELSGQASWLLPFVAFACVGLLSDLRRRKPLTSKQQETLFWLAWLLPAMAFFSVAGFFHHYYLIMLAPPIAALVGAGWVELWNQYRSREGWKRWLLPAAVLATVAFELYILYPYQAQIGIGWPIGIGAAGIGLSLALFLAAHKQKLSYIAALASMLVMLAGPLYWAMTPIVYGGNSMLPQAGPSHQGFGGQGPGGQGGQQPGAGTNHEPGANGGQQPRTSADREPGADAGRQPSGDGNGQAPGGGGMGSGVNTKLLEYVTSHNTGEKFLFATTNAGSAEAYIIQTGKAVMAMGGFSGSDPILTVEKLKKMVANKEVKYFLIPSGSGGGPGGGPGGNNEVTAWIREHGTEVPKEKWQAESSSASQGRPMGMEGSLALYELNP